MNVSEEQASESLLGNDSLVLIPIQRSDAAVIQALANAPDIAEGSLNIVYPLSEDWAEGWIERLDLARQQGNGITFTIQRRDDLQIMGVVSLNDINYRFEHAELAYWLGAPFRGAGYMTTAAWLVMQFAFQQLSLHRIYAFYLSNNLKSERVLQRLGMRCEGELRHHLKKDGVYMNSRIYGVLADEFI